MSKLFLCLLSHKNLELEVPDEIGPLSISVLEAQFRAQHPGVLRADQEFCMIVYGLRVPNAMTFTLAQVNTLSRMPILFVPKLVRGRDCDDIEHQILSLHEDFRDCAAGSTEKVKYHLIRKLIHDTLTCTFPARYDSDLDETNREEKRKSMLQLIKTMKSDMKCYINEITEGVQKELRGEFPSYKSLGLVGVGSRDYALQHYPEEGTMPGNDRAAAMAAVAAGGSWEREVRRRREEVPMGGGRADGGPVALGAERGAQRELG